jgi:hypothetical protein
MDRIFLSKAEIKHTSTKVIITLYVYNKNKNLLLCKLKNIEYRIYLKKYITNMILIYFYIIKEFSHLRVKEEQFSSIFNFLIKYYSALKGVKQLSKTSSLLTNYLSILVKLKKIKINKKQLFSLLFKLDKFFNKLEVTLPDKNRIIFISYNKLLAFNRLKFTN